MNEPHIPGHRSHEEIMKSAAGLSKLHQAGVPGEIISALLEARSAWWGQRTWPPVSVLARIIAVPEIREFDELLFAAIRKRVREASGR